ncbi:glycosyltransferase [Luteipulveratus mongoliensis]|uniref:glycosyltransferase n=1 Tax=Luteipulveratus mongoliensis TaxID=571913 RepID=UPI0006968491|nr:glycosyltransferase family 2 protein [Luteipulveratus mongoliensis]
MTALVPPPLEVEPAEDGPQAPLGRFPTRTVETEHWNRLVSDQLGAPRRDHRGVVAMVRLSELDSLRDKLGLDDLAHLRATVADVLVGDGTSGTWLAWPEDGLMLAFTPAESLDAAERTWEKASRALAARGVVMREDTFHLSAHVGLTTVAGHCGVADTLASAEAALDTAEVRQDLVPRVGRPGDGNPRHSPSRTRFLTRTPVLVLLAYAIALVPPFAAYELIWRFGVDITTVIYPVLILAGVLTSWTVWVECLKALRNSTPTRTGTPFVSPAATALIAAYLPNEAATIEDTVESFLGLEHPGGLQIILAYNSPTRLPVEDRLMAMELRHPQLQLIRVDSSTSKAQNVNAALPEVRGELIGIFDADHHPEAGGFDRAWRWMQAGYDVVQGHCVVRNGGASMTSRVVAGEFEAIYAVSHPGRARWHGFGVFGGSNGFWRTEALRAVRFRNDMLTEDIDSSIRAITMGAKIANDPFIVSTELAPTSWGALWKQRLRWAQGWHQVAQRRYHRAVRSPHLTLRNRLGLTLLLWWAQLMPWVALQTVPVLAFAVIHRDSIDTRWAVPIFLLSTFFTAGTTFLQYSVAWLAAHPSVRRHRRWFVLGALTSVLFYTEFKNAVVRTSHLQELLGQRQWVVTPRGESARAKVTA